MCGFDSYFIKVYHILLMISFPNLPQPVLHFIPVELFPATQIEFPMRGEKMDEHW